MGKQKTGCSINLDGFTFLFGIPTAIIGYHIHNSVGWAILDGLFWSFAWIKWLICQEVNVTIIKSSFAFFFQ